MKIGLCLSGGALRAAAQIGALRWLEEAEVEIAALSGSSAGAVVGLLWAAGWESGRIEAFLRSLRRRDLFRPGWGEPGLFTLDGVERRLRRELGALEYAELRCPCYTCVTELESARSRYLNHGDPIANVLASCALTPIFSPRKIDGVRYIDGGFSDNLPVGPLRERGLPLLSLNVNSLSRKPLKSFRFLLRHSMMVMLNSNIRPSRELSDAYLEIQGVAEMSIFAFSELDDALEAGYREMRAAWPALRQKLERRSVI
jgi:NTE family protein